MKITIEFSTENAAFEPFEPDEYPINGAEVVSVLDAARFIICTEAHEFRRDPNRRAAAHPLRDSNGKTCGQVGMERDR